MARNWSNLNLPAHYTLSQSNCTVDHDWWWPDDAEKLSKAMKEMGWHSYGKRDEKSEEIFRVLGR